MRIRVLLWGLGLCALSVGLADASSLEVAQAAFDLRMVGKVDEAVQRLEEGLAADSTQAILFYELSRARLSLMDIEGMQEAVDEAVTLEPENADYHYFAGLASTYSLINAAHHEQQEMMKHFGERTIGELEAALRCNPDHREARCTLVQRISAMAEDMGWDAARAEEHTRILEKADPVMGARARSNLIPESQQADLWEKVIREHPDQPSAWYEAGGGFLNASLAAQQGGVPSPDLGHLNRASECIDKAIEMNPQRFYILLQLSTAFAMAREWDRAQSIIQRYISLNPPLPLKAYAVARLGQIKQQRGDVSGGTELMSKAMEMDPHLWRGFMPPPEEILSRP
jgi:tetratricopeptide (TPR) repeat protein